MFFFVSHSHSQTNYRYSVDLTKVEDDKLRIELLCPKIESQTILFYFPKIVPGTYINSNFGKYIHDFKATDIAGNVLPLKKLEDNTWEIMNSHLLYRINYLVEDTWDSEITNTVYPMAGTNFEADKNFVINTCGLFGYFQGFSKTTFEVSFIKPIDFYAATGLKPFSTSATKDVFTCASVVELYDSPIMLSLPDTATLKVGNTEVLIAAYSPNKLVSSSFIATHFEKLLRVTKNYL